MSRNHILILLCFFSSLWSFSTSAQPLPANAPTPIVAEFATAVPTLTTETAKRDAAPFLTTAQTFVVKNLPLAYEPESAFFVLSFPRRVVAREAVILPPYRTLSVSGGPTDWLFGAPIVLKPGEVVARASLIVRKANGDTEFIAPSEYTFPLATLGSSEPTSAPQYNLTEGLRRDLVIVQEKIHSWEVQRDAQDESLHRLRADAELIGNLGKVLDVFADTQRVKSEINAAEASISNLQELLLIVKSQPPPRNMVGRETQLSRQMSELAEAARNAERSEAQRHSAENAEVKRKLALIESTRNEDEKTLQAELDRLRKEPSAPS